MPNMLLFIESNTTGTGMLALHKAAKAGLEPVLVTNNPERYAGLAAAPAQVLKCDTQSLDTCRHSIDATLARANIRGITTTSEFYLELTAQLATSYNVSGNPLLAIRTCRNKAMSRQVLARAGVLQPRFAIIQDQDDLGAALSSIGLPCVVKPVDDTGSNMVRLCNTAACAAAHAQRILAAEANVRGQPVIHTALIEEYLDAPEFSVEMFTWQGQTVCIGITEKQLIGAPYFVEHRHVFPACLPDDTAAHIVETVHQALCATGIVSGATHTEIKLTPDGCAIVEINARLAGGMIPELVRHATGLDLLDQQIRVAVGLAPTLTRTVRRAAGIQFLVSPHHGILKNINGIDLARQSTGVEQVTITARSGSRVSPPQNAYDRLGYVIASGEKYAAVVQRLQQAAAHVQLVTT